MYVDLQFGLSTSLASAHASVGSLGVGVPVINHRRVSGLHASHLRNCLNRWVLGLRSTAASSTITRSNMP